MISRVPLGPNCAGGVDCGGAGWLVEGVDDGVVAPGVSDPLDGVLVSLDLGGALV